MPNSVNIRNILDTIVNTIKSRANRICTASCDGLVLRMHYRWTFFVFVGCFLTTWYSWYHRDVIVCVSHFNAETQVRLDYINICLSYPYVEDGEDRRYLLFYRWISWSFIALAGVYYIPRKMSKNFENKKCKSLLEDLASNAHKYDQSEAKLVEIAAHYMFFNLRTHDGLYLKYLCVNVVALLVDNFALQYFDFILQGRFLRYGFQAYPFDRDPENFSDFMSQTFPPFVSCELDSDNQLVNKRMEKFGCHLTIMELYEKVFLVIWGWLILLTFLTCCYIVFLLLMWLPCVRVVLLRTSKPAHAASKVREINLGVIRNCRVGDIYILYRLKSHLSHVRFYELITRLSNPSLYKRKDQKSGPGAPPENRGNSQPNNQVDIVRSQPANVTLDQSMDPDYLYRLFASPDLHARNPRQGEQGQPLLKKNTSILIE